MECNIFFGIGRTGRVFHQFRLFHLRGITGIVVIDLGGFWNFISKCY